MPVLQTLGKHEIRRQLGRGAMGIVYEGWDPVIKRRVAIKTVRLPDPPTEETAEEIVRFRREAEAAGRLNHPNIVGVFDYGETKDLAYIVMELVDGPTLKSLLDGRQPFPIPRVVRIMEDLLTGLQFSHEHGVVHRDIKPANLMLTGAGQAKITDFGIARLETSNITQAGAVLGTPAYMAPEQFLGLPVDARSDIYSCGVLLYQLLTGERPFDGGMSSIMQKALNLRPPAPSTISLTAPRSLDSVVLRAMAKRPEDRFASARDFCTAIREAVAAQPSPPAAELSEMDDAATIVAVPRAKPGGESAGPEPVAAAVSRAPVAAIATPLSPRSTASPWILPRLIGAGVAGLAVLGGLGFFLLSEDRSTPVRSYGPGVTGLVDKERPAVGSAPPAANSGQAVALSGGATGSAASRPPGTASPAEQPPPQTATALSRLESAAVPPPGTAAAPTPVVPPPVASVPAEPAPIAPAPLVSVPAASVPAVPAPAASVPAVPAPAAPAPAEPAPVTPAPVASAAIVPVPVMPPPAAPSPLEQVRMTARSVPCSALSVTSEPGGLRLSGFARPGAELDRVESQARDAGGLTENIVAVEEFACAPLAAVAASVRNAVESNPRTFTVSIDRPEPVSGTRFGIEAATGLPVLYVDLYQANGMVRHLVRAAPAAANHPHVMSVTAPSPGPALIVSIGTARPLAPGARPEVEPAEEYLTVLRRQLDNAVSPAAADLAMITVRPAEPVTAQPRPVEPPVTKTRPHPVEPAAAKAAPPVLRSSRCSNIVSRAQLGETLSNAELTALRTECRS